MGDVEDFEIARLGAQGDGVAEMPDGPVFVALALPGERVHAVRAGPGRARLIDVVRASEQRREPLCRHFGVCGGCSMQHLVPAAYLDWKRAHVLAALRSRGLDADVAPVISVGAGERRRAVLTARRVRDGVLLGFHAEGQDTVVDLAECPVMVGAIPDLFPGLRRLAEPLLSKDAEARVTVIAADGGVSVDFAGIRRRRDASVNAWLADEATRLGLARFTIGNDPVLAAARPIVTFGPAQVNPPPTAFLQASRDAELQMVLLLLAAIPKKAKRAADLFCGIGAFTFPLAARLKVDAIDANAEAVAALSEGVRHTQGLKAISTRVRDLISEPLSRKELEPFDVVVFDPPRAGAQAQAKALAKSKVPVIVAVSCNPGTLARDVRTLVEGGYKLGLVQPIDQFVFSAHVEAVAVLTR